MKKCILSFFSILFVSMPLFAPTIKVASSTANNLIVGVSLPEVEFTKREYQDGNIYSSLKVHGSGIWKIGNPEIPCFGKWILVPNGASAHINTYPGKPVIYKDIDLPPVQPPQPDLKNAPPQYFTRNEQIYNEDKDYPWKFALIEPLKKMRGQSCTILWILPYQYNPVKKTLKVYPDLRVNVDFSGPIKPIPSNLKSKNYEKKILGMALNAREVLNAQENVKDSKRDNNSKTNGCELLIITHDDFESAANTLADWKMKTGLITKVAKTSIIGDTTVDIEAYIDSAVSNWSPAPEYLLFLGDAEYVPTWYKNFHPYPSQGPTGTDIFYADIDNPADYVADLGYGRLSVDTPEQADSLVARIIRYEKIANSNSYYSNTTMAGCFQDGAYGDPPDSVANRRFAKTSEDVRNYLNIQGFMTQRIYATYNGYDYTEIFPKYWSTYYVFENDTSGVEIPADLQKPTFPWNGSTADVSNAVNNGTFFLLHRDHGGRSGWGEPYFRKWDVDALNNGEKRPIVWSINCNTGWFDNETDSVGCGTDFSDECFAEHWLRHNTGGSCGLIAATRVSYSGINDRLVWGWMDAIWPGFLTWCNNPYGGSERIYRIGDVLNYGKEYMRTKYYFDDYIRTALEEFHWLGDPTMIIWTGIPEIMAVSYPSTVSIGSGSLTVYVETTPKGTPIDSAWVCVMKGDEVYERGLTDASGNVILSISSSTIGTLWVTTIGENYIPDEGSALVVCYGDVSPDSVINPTDTVFVDSIYLPGVYVKNMGTDTIQAFDVTCTIDTSGVKGYSDIQPVSNLAGGDSVIVTFSGWTVPFARKSYTITFFASGTFLVDTNPSNDTLVSTVYEYNDAPLVSGLPDTSFSEDDTLYINLNNYVFDSDDPDSSLNWNYSIYETKNKSGVSLKASLPASRDKGLSLPRYSKNSPLYVDIDLTAHIATITADPDWSGSRNIVFTAEDPWGLSDSDTMILTVKSVNDAPVVFIPDTSFNEDDSLMLYLNDYVSDVDNPLDSLIWSCSGNDTIIVDIDPVTHWATFSAPKNWRGSELLIFMVDDATSKATTTDSATITVISVNDLPVIDSSAPESPCSTFVDSILLFYVFAHDVDVTDTLAYDWIINGTLDTTTYTGIYSYSSSEETVDTMKVRVSDGVLGDSVMWIVTVKSIGVEAESPQVPNDFSLSQNCPNPFMQTTEIRYAIPEDVQVEIAIYNILGQKVMTLINRNQKAGYYAIKWSGIDDSGERVASGIYFYRIKAHPTDGGQAEKYTATKKMYRMR
ncbi:T9SS type A sorting domain-containing protein [candidate division WOR-3 bacterium]|nr:T9SS type A sorting domain-containing protein [candidate division WOR-3 bacterium]